MGLNKMGINTSLEQAMALQSCAVKDEATADCLSLQEFSELLFSNDEQFKLDLANLKAPSSRQVDDAREF